jgi:hypothetical protein
VFGVGPSSPTAKSTVPTLAAFAQAIRPIWLSTAATASTITLDIKRTSSVVPEQSSQMFTR